VVAGGFPATAFARDDPEFFIQGHAAWALGRILSKVPIPGMGLFPVRADAQSRSAVCASHEDQNEPVGVSRVPWASRYPHRVDFNGFHIFGAERSQKAGPDCPGSLHIDQRVDHGVQCRVVPKADLGAPVQVAQDPHAGHSPTHCVENGTTRFVQGRSRDNCGSRLVPDPPFSADGPSFRLERRAPSQANDEQRKNRAAGSDKHFNLLKSNNQPFGEKGHGPEIETPAPALKRG